LTPEDVDRIRKLRLEGNMNKKALAKMFGVTPAYVKLVAPMSMDEDPNELKPGQESRHERKAARFVEMERKKEMRLEQWVKRIEKEQNLKGNKRMDEKV
jgi:hypothetical protein